MNKELLYQNSKIFYRIAGSGKPVILLHGFGEDGEVWKNQVRPPQTPPKEGLFFAQSQLTENSLLKSKFKFIIPDLPGSGQSEMIDDMSIEGMAEVIKAITEIEASPNPSEGGASDSDHIKTTSVIASYENPPSEGREAFSSGGGGACIIGHSMGGYITLALVESYWNHVAAFGLFHSSAFADSEEKKATRRKGIEFIKQHGAFEFLKTATPNLFSQQTRDERPELVDEQLASVSSISAEALVSYYEAMIQRPDRTEILQKATVPVLFAMGKYDTAIPLSDGLKQCHLPEKSYIHILQQSGHMGMLEETEKTNLLFKEFLLETYV